MPVTFKLLHWMISVTLASDYRFLQLIAKLNRKKTESSFGIMTTTTILQFVNFFHFSSFFNDKLQKKHSRCFKNTMQVR